MRFLRQVRKVFAAALRWQQSHRAPVAAGVIIALLLLNFEFTAIYVDRSTRQDVHLVHGLQAQQARSEAIARAQKAAQLRQSVGICEAMIGLDDASIGAEFAPASVTGIPLSRSYGYRLAEHIHDVVKATHCAELLEKERR